MFQQYNLIIHLTFPGENIGDESTLAQLGVGPNGTVQLEMQSADPVNTPIKAFRPRQEYVMPDVITVRVETGKDKSFNKYQVFQSIGFSCTQGPCFLQHM